MSACGSNLWPYKDMPASETGQSMGHEAIGVVTDVGDDVRTVKPGQVVVMPFAISDGTCEFCREGLPTACVHVGFFGDSGTNGAQAEALRIPFADGTLYPLDVDEDDALMPRGSATRTPPSISAPTTLRSNNSSDSKAKSMSKSSTEGGSLSPPRSTTP